MCLESEAHRSKQWQVRPEQHTHAHTHVSCTHKMRTPLHWASEAASRLIKATWHPNSSLTSRCRASGSRFEPQAPPEKQSDLGTQSPPWPCTPSNHKPIPHEEKISGGTGWWARHLSQYKQLTRTSANTMIVSQTYTEGKKNIQEGDGDGRGRVRSFHMCTESEQMKDRCHRDKK